MTIEKPHGTQPVRSMTALSRFGRFSLFFATAGFAYPNVFSENIDFAKLAAKYKIAAAKP
jgi:hypothetical protein